MSLRGAILVSVKILAIGGTAALVGGLSFYLSVRSLIFGNEVRVPDLVGTVEETSRQLLAESDLTLEVSDRQFDPAVPEGQVIGQSPAAGASIKTNRKVKVVLSLGTEVLETPDLAAESERKALLEIERQGLRLGEVARVSVSDRPPERVIAQDPRAASPIFRGDRVSLLVSRGPRDPIYVMPDLTGQPVERVRRALAAGGLRLGAARGEASSAPDGTVLRQYPQPGYPVSRREPITVVVSRPPTV